MATMGAPAEKPVEPPADETPTVEVTRHRFLGAIDEDNLFATATAVMDGDPKLRQARMRSRLRFSVIAHVVVLALIILVPLFMPEPLPEQGDRRVVFFDPPPPPPPPMQKGSSARPEQVKPEAPKKVVDTPKPDFTAPIEQQPVDKPLEPEKGVKPEEQFGSETGSDLGDALGMEGGVEGGQVGGVPGGVLGGVIGGTGTGPVMDYDTPPRPIKQPRPQYPQEAFIKKIEGTVLVEILIDAQGRVARARVVQSVPMLDAAALQTVYQWVFMPAIKHGKPVATLAHIPVAFRIY
jgi:periplasmic protein TonB